MAMQDENDFDLCRRLKAADREALGEVYRLHRPHLVRYALSIVKDNDVAHDLVQDVFMYLWKLRDSLDETRPLRPYLYTMTRNRSMRHLRDERTHQRKHDQIKGDAQARQEHFAWPSLKLDADSLAEHLQSWLQELPPRQSEALMLSRYQGLSHREVARVMNVSPRTVNNHLVRALDYLQQKVRAYEATVSTS